MDNIARYIPLAEGSEYTYLKRLAKCVTDEEFEHFVRLYVPNRKDKNTTLILCILGLIGLGGIHRFYLGKIGTGILYFLTTGLFYIGTIYDLFRYAEMVSDENVITARNFARYIDVKLDNYGNPVLP